MVEKSIMSGIFLLDHSYQLVDTARRIAIGRGESEIYGRSLSLGIITADNFLIVPGAFAEPWRFDTTYRPRDHYLPKTFEVNARRISDTIFERFKYDTCLKSDNGLLYSVPYNTSHGYYIDIVAGTKKGFYAIFSSLKPLSENINSAFACTLYEKELEVKSGQKVYDVDVSVSKGNVVGGIYVVPCYDDPGTLSYQVVGIMQYVDGKWKVITFNK